MGGEFASFNQNFTHANYSEIITSGNYFHFSVGYQLPLKTWNLKDKSEKKQEKELKKREAEEQKQREADEKERIAEEKRKAKLEKEEAKKKQLDEKEVENEDKLKTDASGKPKELKGRSIKIQEEFEVNSLVIELSLWDDGAEIDGDSVDVFFNGEWIKKNVGLTKSRQIITLNIDPKQKNYLIIYAINEGEHSPNTAAISFNNGTREKKFRIHSKINENGAVRFKYKE